MKVKTWSVVVSLVPISLSPKVLFNDSERPECLLPRENSWANRKNDNSLRASSPIWASETSLARVRERAAKRLARSREVRLACPNRRACSQA